MEAGVAGRRGRSTRKSKPEAAANAKRGLDRDRDGEGCRLDPFTSDGVARARRESNGTARSFRFFGPRVLGSRPSGRPARPDPRGARAAQVRAPHGRGTHGCPHASACGTGRVSLPSPTPPTSRGRRLAERRSRDRRAQEEAVRRDEADHGELQGLPCEVSRLREARVRWARLVRLDPAGWSAAATCLPAGA